MRHVHGVLLGVLLMTGCATSSKVSESEGGSFAWQWLESRKSDRLNVFVAEALKALEIRFSPPVDTPYPENRLKRQQFVKAYRAGWEETLLGEGSSTCCEAVESVTVGWYAGQEDAQLLLEGIEEHLEKDDRLVESLKSLRQSIRKNPTRNWYIADY